MSMYPATLTASNFAPPQVTCSICKHKSSRHNFSADFTRGAAFEVCSFCRNPLKAEGT